MLSNARRSWRWLAIGLIWLLIAVPVIVLAYGFYIQWLLEVYGHLAGRT